MIEIYIGKGEGGHKRIRYAHRVYVDKPHVQSYTSYVLLQNELLLQDVDYIATEWKKRVEFSRNFLRNVLAAKGDLTCKYCNKNGLIIELEGMRVPKKRLATTDHVVPVSKGGALYDYKNVVVACYYCNTRKGDKDLAEFIKSLKVVPHWTKEFV